MYRMADINTLVIFGQDCGNNLLNMFVFPTKFIVVHSERDRDNSRSFFMSAIIRKRLDGR